MSSGAIATMVLALAATAASAVERPTTPTCTTTVRLVMMSDRVEQMVAVMESAHSAAAPKTCLQWSLFTTDAARLESVLDDELPGQLAPAAPVPPASSEYLAGTGEPFDSPEITPRHSFSITTLEEAEIALEERGITPVWTLPGFRAGAAGKPRRTPWSLRERSSDSDAKHAHPLNLLRFYLPELPILQHAERVLLLDDDICVQHDLAKLFDSHLIGADVEEGAEEPKLVSGATDGHTHSLAAAQHSARTAQPVVLASCQMQQYDGAAFRIRDAHYTYAETPFVGTIGGPSGYPACPPSLGAAALDGEDDEEDDNDEDEEGTSKEDVSRAIFAAVDAVPVDYDLPNAAPKVARPSVACAPAALEPKLAALHKEFSGRGEFRNETAWNFGTALFHLRRWRARGLSKRFEQWFLANEHFAFFAPRSMSFGLGIAYLALAGQVGCWPERTVLDALGFLTWDDLQANQIGEAQLKVRSVHGP